MKTWALVLVALCSSTVNATFLQKKNPGFDGFGAPDPFNRKNDAHSGEEGLLQVNGNAEEDESEEDDAFLRKAKKALAKKHPDMPDPDAQVDASEPNAPPQDVETDPNLVSENEARSGEEGLLQVNGNAEEDESEEDDAFLRKAKKALAKNKPGIEDPDFEDNPDEEDDGLAPKMNDPAGYKPEEEKEEKMTVDESDGSEFEEGDSAFLQKAKKALAKKQPDPDAQVDSNEPNAPQEGESHDPNVVTENHARSSHEAFLQTAETALTNMLKMKNPYGDAPSPDMNVDTSEPPQPAGGEDSNEVSENQGRAGEEGLLQRETQ